MTSLFLIITI